MRNCIIGAIFLLAALALVLCQCGCVIVKTTRTTYYPDGRKVVEEANGKAFLESLQNGTVTNRGMGFSVNSATPDQQSIAILSGTVADISKAAMLLSSHATNSASVSTNKP